MINNKSCIAAIALGIFSSMGHAAVSPEEAHKLGNELTLFGALQAPNSDNTIPEYTGGIEFSSPDGTPPDRLVDPFTADQPLFRIDQTNVDEHIEKLSEGAIHLLRNSPGYYMDIYPTRRTVTFPPRFLDRTVENATNCVTEEGGLAVSEACRGGRPFPIPRTGNEMMWNLMLAYTGSGSALSVGVAHWIVTGNGNKVMASRGSAFIEKPYYSLRSDRNTNMAQRLYSKLDEPSRKAGEATGYAEYLNPVRNVRDAWSYAPGQRRVKRAPAFNYDTPVSTSGGAMTYDEIFMFSGAMDRFDFVLLGQQEMFIPYNNYKMHDGCTADQMLQPGHINPECMRWELHRTWVVEATLKQGQRHAYSKRRYYIDEDNNLSGVYDGWDQAGRLYRSLFNTTMQDYRHDYTIGGSFVIHDFTKGMYSLQSDLSQAKWIYTPEGVPERELNPEFIAGQGIR